MKHSRLIAGEFPHLRESLVLIVEDDVPMNTFLHEILSKEYRIETALNGEEGLEKATRLRPDLILTDIMMPKMTGDAMFRAIRSMPELTSIPVMILSATSDDDLRMKLLREGAEDYIIKPFRVEEVLSRVRNLLRMKRVALENARLYLEAKKGVALREEILGIVSHDLRNPLTAIRLRNQLILKISEQAPTREKIEKQVLGSERSIQQMERMIGDLLDFAKIQSKSFSIVEKENNVFSLIEDGIKLMENSAGLKSIAVIPNFGAKLPAVSCDADRILQVFSNLLSNAIKFTPDHGTIRVGAMKTESVVQFSVTDQGPGIAADNLQRIFEKFWQARETARLGTGLGLSIAKGIIEAHGGQIWAESTLGLGSTFHFTLPLEKAAVVGLRLTRKEEAEGRTDALLALDGDLSSPGI